MHLIFERSNGRFKSNCNILALAWMPYYDENKFRQALLDYHQKQLMNITNPNQAREQQQQQSQQQISGQVSVGALRRHIDGNSGNRSPSELIAQHRNINQSNGDQSQNGRQLSMNDCDNLRFKERALNSRIIEQYHRYVLMKFGPQVANNRTNNAINRNRSNNLESNASEGSSPQQPLLLLQHSNLQAINNELDVKYGRMGEFGWLALGNIGKMIGITLTSTVPAPVEIESRQKAMASKKVAKRRPDEGDDLIILDADDEDEQANNQIAAEKNNRLIGNIAAQNVGDYDRLRPDRKCARTNFNLRGHLDEVIIVRWNELYQKLATVDCKGNVLIWCKVNDKFTIQTPFYNRTKTVADFKWSNDGKTALICYTDSFILVGSSSGQRHWHSMLNLEDYHITCASYTPNDEQLLFGVSNGNVVVIDLPRSELTELVVSSQVNIRAMCWSSSCGLDLRNLKQPNDNVNDQPSSSRNNSFGHRNSIVISHRRLSRDCSVFSRYRFCSQGPTNVSTNNSAPSNQLVNQLAFNSSCPPNNNLNSIGSSLRNARLTSSSNNPNLPKRSATFNSRCQDNILAIDFADNTIRLYIGGLNADDCEQPKHIQVGLESYIISWSSDGQILAVAGFNIYTSAPTIGCLRCRYINVIKFYNRHGKLIHEHKMNYSRYPITAFTWAHENKRIFVATGPRLHCAQVISSLPSLALLSLSCLQIHLKLADKVDILENLFSRNQFSYNVLNWQSFECSLELRQNILTAQRQPAQRGFIMSSSSCSSSGNNIIKTSAIESIDTTLQNLYNSNISRLDMHPKLSQKLDELFSLTIRQPFDEQLSLNDIAWHVPKNNQRYYCTLVCYTSESMDGEGGVLGPQYRTDILERNLSSQIGSGSGSQTGTSDQYKIFVLYAEFQGSLIPILKARRVGFLKPEFVIFDPERENSNRNLLHQRQKQKVSDVSSRGQQKQQMTASNDGFRLNSLEKGGPNDLEAYYQLEMNCHGLHNHPETFSSFTNGDSPASCGSIDRSGHHSHMHSQTPVLNERYRKKFSSHLSKNVLERNRHLARSATNSTKTVLPETNELIRIKSNVWGTKFRLVNSSNQTIKVHRLRLGAIEYKASILHLQPRQICLRMRNMSNYCVLCSTHHHSVPGHEQEHQPDLDCSPVSLSYSSKQKHKLASKQQFRSSDQSRPETVLPSLIGNHDGPTIPPRIPPRRSTQFGAQRKADDNKVVLAVGDSIKIAPKLEPNQRYKLQPRYSPSVFGSQKYVAGSSSTHAAKKSHLNDAIIQKRLTQSATKKGSRRNSSNMTERLKDGASTSYLNAGLTNEDDILTLSLDQGDRVLLNMLPESANIEDYNNRPSTSQAALQPMNEFLESNKTLKSIQTITKMIVDLSAKACEEDDTSDNDELGNNRNEGQQCSARVLEISPKKLLKTKRQTDVALSPAKHYIMPETPIHRPKTRDVSRLMATRTYCPSQNGQRMTTQSASITPSKRYHLSDSNRKRRASQEAETSSIDLLASSELPPPPPSVPFGRRLTSSAKRLFDGSLRSLTGLGGYPAASDNEDTEDCEPLVGNFSARNRYSKPPNGGRLSRFVLNYDHAHAKKGMLEPLMRSRSDLGQSKQQSHQSANRNLDLSQLSNHLLQRFRDSTKSWRSRGAQLDSMSNDTSSELAEAGSSRRSRSIRKGLREVRGGSTSRCDSSYYGLSDVSDSDLSDSSIDSSVPDGSIDRSLINERFCFDLSSNLNETNKQRWSSARSLDNHEDQSKELSQRRQPSSNVRRRQPRRRHDGQSTSIRELDDLKARRRLIIRNLNCCCNREFEMNNRPPVWNEQSQVYQLDFSGRVTQESAKNLQIDFEGNLALQFGRIDRCTYTLDYKYPFNAIQAMSVALASLTQRLK